MNNSPYFLQLFWKVIDATIAILLSVMIVLVFANVILRYVNNASLGGATEQSQYLFVWIVMLGAVVCIRYDEHLSLTLLVENMPAPLRRFCSILKNAVIAVSGLMLCIGGYLQADSNWANILPMGGIPVGLLYFSGAVSGFLMAIMGTVRIFLPSFDIPVSDAGETHS